MLAVPPLVAPRSDGYNSVAVAQVRRSSEPLQSVCELSRALEPEISGTNCWYGEVSFRCSIVVSLQTGANASHLDPVLKTHCRDGRNIIHRNVGVS